MGAAGDADGACDSDRVPAARSTRSRQPNASAPRVQALSHPRVAERHPGERVHVVRLDQIAQAQFDGIGAQVARQEVQRDLHGRADLGGAVSPGASGDRRGRVRDAAVVAVPRHPVEPQQLVRHHLGVVRRAARVGAGVEEGVGVHSPEHAVRAGGQREAGGGGAPDHRGVDALLPVERQTDGAPETQGEKRGDRLQDELLLAAEGAAHGQLDDAHAIVGEAEQVRDDHPRAEHALRRAPDGQLAGRVVVGDAGVRLERGVVDARRRDGGREDEVLRLRRDLVPGDHVELVHQVAARVDRRRAVAQRRLGRRARRAARRTRTRTSRAAASAVRASSATTAATRSPAKRAVAAKRVSSSAVS